jgi:hypothetical protein
MKLTEARQYCNYHLPSLGMLPAPPEGHFLVVASSRSLGLGTFLGLMPCPGDDDDLPPMTTATEVD